MQTVKGLGWETGLGVVYRFGKMIEHNHLDKRNYY